MHTITTFDLLSMALSLFLLALLSSICIYPDQANSKPHNNITDLESLLAFKAQVRDPLGILSTNWTTNTSFCSWIGITCSRRHQRVASLSLKDAALQGTISPHLANLSFLSNLYLSNNTLTGSIPNVLGRLHRLKVLTLEINYLSGCIPSSLFNMSSLIELYLTHNSLSGSLPTNHSIRAPLQVVALRANQLTGHIPTTFASFLNLQVLDLGRNNLTGTIPADLGGLLELRILYLHRNMLSGEIPPSLGNLTQLRQLELVKNNLTGLIPKELGDLSKLQTLLLDLNGLTGTIPKSLLNASMITVLALAVNNLIGHVPSALGESMPMLERLFLGGNSLTGSLNFVASLHHCKNLKYLAAEENELEGSLPNYIGNLSANLSYIFMSHNRIKGNIPTELGNLSNLLLLNLDYNELTGEVPPTLARLHNLQEIRLGYNSIGGLIPSGLGRLTNLDVISLQSNILSGAIPDSMGNLTMLQHLSLGDNQLSSKLPQSVWKLKSLIELDLSQNALFGSIPPEVSNLNVLDVLDLSENQLSGNISAALGELNMLRYLDLSRNSFHGQIPESLGGLINIQKLNLSRNFLSGAIPKSLANLHYLDNLNLSFNMLEGEIPKGRVFSNLNIPSLQGNKALCGASQLGFPPCVANISNSHSKGKSHLLKYILPVVAFIVALSCLILVITILGKRKAATMGPTNSQHLGSYRVVSYHELVHATNNFSQDNLLGRGSFGSVFKGYLNDGLIVAIKVLNLDVDGATKSFDAECQVLFRVRHRNLIKIIGMCFNLDFKAIILQFIPNGSLDNWLYSESRSLTLLQRLNILLDVSSALEYLHHHHPQVILHCDLKPSNILLDEDMVAHVSDFGIAKLLLGGRSAASASAQGTIGYIAPEIGSTGGVSKMGDVYSFGILLLETFTGKRPTDIAFDGESTLRECVHKAYPAALRDIVDGSLLKDDSTIERKGQTTAYHCVSSIVELGLLCSSYSPNERIPMLDVVPRLTKIKAKYLAQLSGASSVVTCSLA